MTSKRQQLIETAFELFYQHGIHGVGINQILAQAGVAKKTLYSHFDGKSALVEAVLDYRDKRFFDWLMSQMQAVDAGTPAILAMFDALDDWFNNRTSELSDFNGCFFINSCSDYADPQSPPHRLCAAHKQKVRALIAAQVDRIEQVEDKPAMVDWLAMLKEGAIVSAQVQGDKTAAIKARQLAMQLLSVP
jgi:AcrR family transcriptional regulator